MRFPDEDDYRYAGGLKRLWYMIICPFTYGERLWMVTTSILCALAVVQSVNGPSGYHGSAQYTGFLSGNFVNGVRIAWEINAEDAGLDRIDNFRVGYEYIYLVGYKGAQRSVVAFDASYSTPRELWRTNVDDEEGVNWWGDDLLVGNTLVSTADGSTTTIGPIPTRRISESPYHHPTGSGPSTGPIGPVRLYCPTPSSAPCQAWDKTGTHVWDFDASTGSFPDSVTPLEGWVPLRAWKPSSAGPAMGYTLDELTGFLNVDTGERVGLEAIEEACGPATLEDSKGIPYCRITSDFKYQHLILRASDGWIVGDGVGYIATVAPDGSNPQVMHLENRASERLLFLRTYPDLGSAQTLRQNSSCTLRPRARHRGTPRSPWRREAATPRSSSTSTQSSTRAWSTTDLTSTTPVCGWVTPRSVRMRPSCCSPTSTWPPPPLSRSTSGFRFSST